MARRLVPRRFHSDLSLDQTDSDGSDGGGARDSSAPSGLDGDLESVHRNVMARTGQKYLVMDASSFPDRFFTALLIAATMVAILVLFWFQNFGPGFHFHHVKH